MLNGWNPGVKQNMNFKISTYQVSRKQLHSKHTLKFNTMSDMRTNIIDLEL